jgi:hypothetical protein
VISSEVSNDPFVRNLLARVPAEARATFTDAQLLALKAGALGGIETGKHPIDFRHSVKFWRWKHYDVVFVAGTNRRTRELTPEEERIAHVLGVVGIAILALLLSMFGYALLSWLGISHLLAQDLRM